MGLVRHADPKVRELNYGGKFNITLELKKDDKLGLKLGNMKEWGVKVRKIYKNGLAFSMISTLMFFKK